MKSWDITLAEDNRIYLFDIPFRAGEMVRVTVEPLSQLIPQEPDDDDVPDDDFDDVFVKLRAVKDRATFLQFVEALANEKVCESAIEEAHPSNPYGPGALG